MAEITQGLNIPLLSRAIDQNLSLITFDLSHRVTYVNQNFSETLGYERNEMIGLDHASLCFPAFTQSSDYQLFWKNLINGNSFQDKIRRRGKAGNEVWLEATYMPIFDEGNVIEILKIATDITHRENRVKRFASDLQKMASDLNRRSIDGTQHNDTLTQEILKVEEYSNKNTETLSTLQEEVKKINGIANIIKRISEQTNILALNAGIEGARAGESGKGFTIIAREMQELSKKVKQSIKIVEEQSSLITSGVSQIAEGTNELHNDIHVSRETVEKTVHSFGKIAQAAEELNLHASEFKNII